jgi:hypothetical protein
MAYVENATIIADHESEIRIVVEPGYMDDRDRDAMRWVVEVKGTRSEMRLPYADVRPLAEALLSAVAGRPVKVTTKKVPR